MVEQQHRPGTGWRGRAQGSGSRHAVGKRLAGVDKTVALGPDLRRQLVGRGLRLLGVVANHHHAHAGLGNIGLRETGEDADCLQASRFELLGALHRALHRALAGGAAQRVRQQRRPGPGQDWAWPAVEPGKSQARSMGAGLGHVHMRIGFEADHDVGARQHGLAEVAVQVKGERQRGVGRNLADAAQQLGFAIVEALGGHRAMQVKQDQVAAVAHRLDDRVLSAS